ncbi:hypothetical protein BT96DRAFT_303167 [Gymnopus androsaceus JB14]|uniref:Uncharacterized protein n=1 Tax=Gymnopus androsaceus JB14 TaxID=1447944 RepID=A0A6A4H0H8_9AGAR|nr:hypothetical protein BT96DRAFT_303167 [Gymnopus androsaceus JB14]
MLNYKPPPLVASLQKSCTKTIEAGRTLSIVLLSISLFLLLLMKSPIISSHTGLEVGPSRLKTVIFTMNYTTIMLHLSSVYASFILIDQMSKVQLDALHHRISQHNNDAAAPNAIRILQLYGLEKSWKWIFYHWILTMGFGIICSLSTMMMFVWMYESLPLRIAVTCVTGILVLSHVTVLFT